MFAFDSGHEGFIAAVVRRGGVRSVAARLAGMPKNDSGLPVVVFDGLCGRLASGLRFPRATGGTRPPTEAVAQTSASWAFSCGA